LLRGRRRRDGDSAATVSASTGRAAAGHTIELELLRSIFPWHHLHEAWKKSAVKKVSTVEKVAAAKKASTVKKEHAARK
jgi:hypothetical protein